MGASAGVGIALGPIAGGWLLERFWWGAIFVAMVPVAVVVAALASPMIDVSLFRNPRFTAASAAVAISFFALLGFIFLMTQYFQVVRAYSPLSAGVRLLPVAVTVGVAAVAGTRLAVLIGNKIIVGGGMAFFCARWPGSAPSPSTLPTASSPPAWWSSGLGWGLRRRRPPRPSWVRCRRRRRVSPRRSTAPPGCSAARSAWP